jgi:hypothetical protein
MAEDAPESIFVGQFTGLKNAVTPERLKPEELQHAFNVDLDNEGQARRREGFRGARRGDCHSLFSTPSGNSFVVSDGWLSRVTHGYHIIPITLGGARRLSYVEVDGILYYSSEAVSGKIMRDFTPEPWGQIGGAAEWFSPVVNPTDTLPEINGKPLSPPPMGSHLTAINGRIYIADDKTLWATELYLYDYVDRTKGFVQFDSKITGLAYSGDGIYVGTETGVWFLRGGLNNMERRIVVRSRHIPYSMVEVPGDYALVAGEPALQYRNAVMFMTEDGLIAGFNGGFCRNLTENEMIFPKALTASPMFRKRDGINQYVVTTKTGGSPSANARIGDYVDAEIVRRP